MNLKKLHREFIENAYKSTIPNTLPINAKIVNTPIIPTSKWRKENGVLIKHFTFSKVIIRNKFVESLLQYEAELQHQAQIVISEDNVEIRLITKDINKITELDKEYAKHADLLFRDLAYNNFYEISEY